MQCFEESYTKFIRPELKQVFNVDSNEKLKFLTRIRLGWSHLADHKFKRNFQDFVNPICRCGQDIETSTYFLLHCCNYHCARQSLFEKINKIDSTVLNQNDQDFRKLLPFGNEKLKAAKKQIHIGVYNRVPIGYQEI